MVLSKTKHRSWSHYQDFCGLSTGLSLVSLKIFGLEKSQSRETPYKSLGLGLDLMRLKIKVSVSTSKSWSRPSLVGMRYATYSLSVTKE